MCLRLSIGFLFLVLALTGPAQVTVFENHAGDGFWGTAANWSGGAVPGASDNAVVNNGRVATIASNAPPVDIVTVGNGPIANTLLVIDADLTANRFRIAWPSRGIGSVRQLSGTVTISNILRIASTSANSYQGIYTMEGGSLLFPQIKFEVGSNGKGIFEVQGSGPVSIRGGDMTLGRQGMLRFTLDTLGVTPIQLTGTFTVDASSQLVIDGTHYEALDGYFPLVHAVGQDGVFDPGNVTFVGFDGRKPALVQEPDGIWLRTLAPPGLSDHLFSLVPESTVATDYSNTQFSASRAYEPSGSAWGVSYSEAHVMDTRLSQQVVGGGGDANNRSWDLRVGRGGHLYSFRTPALGETVPPSKTGIGDSVWIDEVWQGVAVAQFLNDPNNGSPYFLHQSGVYLRDPVLTEPFYSPQVAAQLNEEDRSFTTINWTPHAHVNIYTDGNSNNDFTSYMLAFTRYRDLGQGLIEVSLGYYNYGPHLITWMNMPWGGVRRTSTEYAFISQRNGTSWSSPVANSWSDSQGIPLNDTGGWVGFSASRNGDTPSLGLVFGRDRNPLPVRSVGSSWYRAGYAGGTFSTNEASWRNYLVSSTIRRYNLSQGNGIWSRTYFVLGDSLSDISSRIAARNVVGVELREFDYRESTTPSIGYSFSGSGENFRIVVNHSSPDFYLYAHPVKNSFPVFEMIKNDASRCLTWNPYATGIVKPYDGTLAGLRLLGFALRSADINRDGTVHAYTSLSDLLSTVTSSYVPDGEDLSVRLFPNADQMYDEWASKHGLEDADPLADPDLDGQKNQLEYALGGDPADPAVQGVPPSVALDPGEGREGPHYVYLRRRDAEPRGLTYQVLCASSLVSAVWSTNGSVEIGAGLLDENFEVVTNRVEVSPGRFIKLQVTFE